MRTPITKRSLKVHWTYSWWKYLLSLLVIAGMWNILYVVTAYRPPEDKKIELYALGVGDQDALDAYLKSINDEHEMGMELVGSRFLMNDQYYGTMTLTVYMGAAEGDIYILPRDNFRVYAEESAFLPLEDQEELIALLGDADLTNGWRRAEGERHLFGIPASLLPGLSRFMQVPADSYVSVLTANQNTENVFRFLNYLVEDNLTLPEGATPTDLYNYLMP